MNHQIMDGRSHCHHLFPESGVVIVLSMPMDRLIVEVRHFKTKQPFLKPIPYCCDDVLRCLRVTAPCVDRIELVGAPRGGGVVVQFGSC